MLAYTYEIVMFVNKKKTVKIMIKNTKRWKREKRVKLNIKFMFKSNNKQNRIEIMIHKNKESKRKNVFEM